LANNGEEYTDPDELRKQMNDLFNGGWDGLTETELAAHTDKFNRLNKQLAESIKRMVGERNDFAAATTTYAQKADERGDDPRELGKIVKRVEQEAKGADPFKPDGEDADDFAPGAKFGHYNPALNAGLKILWKECKTTQESVADEATKESMEKLTNMLTGVMHNVNRQQQVHAKKRRREDGKQYWHKSAQLQPSKNSTTRHTERSGKTSRHD
jgi:hypothetical protein